MQLILPAILVAMLVGGQPGRSRLWWPHGLSAHLKHLQSADEGLPVNSCESFFHSGFVPGPPGGPRHIH